MKFFHLSDLHLGLKLLNRDLHEDQAYILSQIADYAGVQQPDAVVIAGDIYDKPIPSAEAVTLFDDFLTRLTERAPGAAILLISLELEEVMSLADTIGVIYNGQLLKIADAGTLTSQDVGRYMMGVTEA